MSKVIVGLLGLLLASFGIVYGCTQSPSMSLPQGCQTRDHAQYTDQLWVCDSVIDTADGGTGQDFSGVAANRIPYFSAIGTMNSTTSLPSAVQDLIVRLGILERLQISNNGTAQAVTSIRASNDDNAAVYSGDKSRGTIASPANVQNNDQTMQFQASAYSNGWFATGAARFVVDGTFVAGQRPPSRFEIITNPANSSGNIRWLVNGAGNLLAFVDGTPDIGAAGANRPHSIYITECFVAGNATGGCQGTGTINVSGDIYKNGVAYTNPDYVFEYHVNGQVTTKVREIGYTYDENCQGTPIKDVDDNNTGEFDKSKCPTKPVFEVLELADTYNGLMPLAELETYILANKQLPRVAEQRGMFERSDILLEKIEELTLYIIELNKRINQICADPQVTVC